jgi:hypothetical protein
VLGDFEHQAVAAIVGLERGEDRRQLAFEGDVDDRADDLRDLANQVARGRGGGGRRGSGGLLAAGLGGSGGGHV